MSLDDLQEKIAEFEDYVQSSDVAAMQSMSPCSPNGFVSSSDEITQNCKHRRVIRGVERLACDCLLCN